MAADTVTSPQTSAEFREGDDAAAVSPTTQ